MELQEVRTHLPPRDVIEQARTFFTQQFSPYAGFEADESDTHIRFRFEAGELLVAAVPQDDYTLVRGSTSRLHHELSQFLATLAPPEEVRQNTIGPGTSGAG